MALYFFKIFTTLACLTILAQCQDQTKAQYKPAQEYLAKLFNIRTTRQTRNDQYYQRTNLNRNPYYPMEITTIPTYPNQNTPSINYNYRVYPNYSNYNRYNNTKNLAKPSITMIVHPQDKNPSVNYPKLNINEGYTTYPTINRQRYQNQQDSLTNGGGTRYRLQPGRYSDRTRGNDYNNNSNDNYQRNQGVDDRQQLYNNGRDYRQSQQIDPGFAPYPGSGIQNQRVNPRDDDRQQLYNYRQHQQVDPGFAPYPDSGRQNRYYDGSRGYQTHMETGRN